MLFLWIKVVKILILVEKWLKTVFIKGYTYVASLEKFWENLIGLRNRFLSKLDPKWLRIDWKNKKQLGKGLSSKYCEKYVLAWVFPRGDK